MAEVEQPGQPGQDPAQQEPSTTQSPPSAPPSPPELQPPPQQPAPPPGPAPWQADLEQTFQDPAVRGQVDAYLRSNWQPRMTQYEQQIAQAREAQQLFDAYQQDPDAANIAVNRQLYGDEYADQLASSLGRFDQVVNPPQQQEPVQQQQAWQQPQQQQAPQPSLEGDPVYDYWKDKYENDQYDAAVDEFLKDPQYADINKELFHTHLKGAETWDEAVASYRNYAAHWAQTRGENVQPPPPPPTIGSQAVGAPGSTPAQPNESLNDAIDGIFSENRPLAPTVLGGQ